MSNFLNDIPTDRVAKVAGCYEILMEHDREPQILLSRAVASGARVTRFELAEASLNDIFIRTVQSANGAKTNGSELKGLQYA